MRRSKHIIISVLLFVSGLQLSAAADVPNKFEFDIYVEQGLLITLLDLSPYLTSERIEDLKDGRRFVLEIECRLKRPGRIWGSELVAKGEKALRIEYLIVTESYRLNSWQEEQSQTKQFVSLAGLHRFLSDSVIIPLVSVDSLDGDFSYVLEIDLRSITSSLVTASIPVADSNKTESPLRFLFGKFLNLTGYGRQELRIESTLFRIADLRRTD